MSRIRFEHYQHPVGQGGFQTGWIYDRDSRFLLDPVVREPLFSWVYDCGSVQISTLHSEINRVRSARFNALFLSHLDSDHVIGVDNLLGLAEAAEVVLPYLSDDDWALHLAAGITDGSLTGSFIDLAEDPAGWFGRRGVDRVTYVRTGLDTDEDPLGPDPVEPGAPETGELSRELRIKLRWTRHEQASSAISGGAGRAQVAVAPAGAVAMLAGTGGALNWILSPFAFPPSSAKMKAFSAELAKRFGKGLSARQYADAARTGKGRAKLRACYDAVWKTHNLHSMALYSGPAAPPVDKVHYTAWHGSFVHRIIHPGWVSTGDFDTSVKVRRDRLVRFYARYAWMVGQLGLPHHGSDLSFDAAILAAFPNLASAIAAVGPNGHGHPGLAVQASIAAVAGLDFRRVDENPSSRYCVAGPVTG